MAHLIKIPTNFDILNLKLVSQIYEFAGETNDLVFVTPLPSESNIKTILVKGSIQISYPDSDTPAIIAKGMAKVWPPEGAVGKTKISFITLEDNVEILCIQPYDGYKIVSTDTPIVSNEAMVIDTGVLLFVEGTKYIINNNEYTGFNIFAVQNNSISINAVENCRAVIFRAVPL